CACDLLKILERKRQSRPILIGGEVCPRQFGELPALHAIEAQANMAIRYLSGLQGLCQGQREVVDAGGSAAGKVDAVYVEALELAAVGKAAVEREVRAQRGDFFLAIMQALLKVGISRSRYLVGPLQHGDALEQCIAFLVGACLRRGNGTVAVQLLQL